MVENLECVGSLDSANTFQLNSEGPILWRSVLDTDVLWGEWSQEHSPSFFLLWFPCPSASLSRSYWEVLPAL